MDACPDFIGVVKIFAFLELESRYSGKHFSKVSDYQDSKYLCVSVKICVLNSYSGTISTVISGSTPL